MDKPDEEKAYDLWLGELDPKDLPEPYEIRPGVWVGRVYLKDTKPQEDNP